MSCKSHIDNGFFSRDLQDIDPEIFFALEQELIRQENQIELIASENIVSKAVLEAQGSIFTNKYAEGYSGHRYYGGCEFMDVAETLAIERAKKLFGADFVNVQPHSGAQANGAVLFAFLHPGDTLMGMSISSGGHLTHGSGPTMSGRWFNSVQYGVCKDSSLIDYNEVEELALKHRPKLIIAGGSAYPRIIDFKRFREIADRVGALLMVDMAHFAGLVAGGIHPNPLEYADIVTTTTHKTLRGPRGGMILSKNPDIGKKINSAVFPGMQGGPLMHIIAAKAVAFGEALRPEFKVYAERVVSNAKALGEVLKERGFDLVSGGTDTHLILVDLRSKGLTGNIAEQSLERAHMTCNKNSIPYDPEKPMITSGIRLGTPAGTTRGFTLNDFKDIGEMIGDVLDGLSNNKEENSIIEKVVKEKVIELCNKYPIYKFATAQEE